MGRGANDVRVVSRASAAAKVLGRQLARDVQEDVVTAGALVQVAGRGAAILTHGTRLVTVEPKSCDRSRRALSRVVEVDVLAQIRA